MSRGGGHLFTEGVVALLDAVLGRDLVLGVVAGIEPAAGLACLALGMVSTLELGHVDAVIVDQLVEVRRGGAEATLERTEGRRRSIGGHDRHGEAGVTWAGKGKRQSWRPASRKTATRVDLIFTGGGRGAGADTETSR